VSVRARSFGTTLFGRLRLSHAFAPAYWRFRRALHPIFFLAALVLSLLAAALVRREAGLLGISLALWALLQWLMLRAAARGLTVSRGPVPERTTEGAELTITFELWAGGRFVIHDVMLEDACDVTAARSMRIHDPRPLRPGRPRSLRYRCRADSGMGLRTVGPGRVFLRDPFGLFEFYRDLPVLHTVHVFPRVERILPLPLRGSLDALRPGQHETVAPGHSVNLAGVREYVRGDSLRHIAWRLSARANRLLVKQFERMSGCEVTLLLQLAGYTHVGTAVMGTWSMAIRAALSIAREQASLGNPVQLLAQGCMVPMGSGVAHFGALSKRASTLQPAPGCRDTLAELTSAHLPLIPGGSTIFLIAPMAGGEEPEWTHVIRLLCARRMQVFVVAVDSGAFYATGGKHGPWLQPSRRPPVTDTSILRLRLAGALAAVLRPGDAMSKALRFA
jgi:uncharacterized protein (DUF58 family)